MPGRNFIKSEVLANQALVAATAIESDLGVNGLSHLFFAASAKQSANNTAVTVANMLNAIGQIDVLYNGAAYISGQARDLAVLSSLIANRPPYVRSQAQAANAEVLCAFCLPLGRQLYGASEGFPKVQRGTLRWRVTPAAAFTNLASISLNIQQVEMPDNQFRRVNKYTQRAITPAATGDNDLRLPIGNWLRGILVFETTAMSDFAAPGDIASMRLLANNEEELEVGGQGMYDRWMAEACGDWHPATQEHAHISDVAAAYTQFQSTRTEQVAGNPIAHNYLWMELDPTHDDACSLETAGLSDLFLRMNINTSGEAIRVLPYESVAIGPNFGR